MRNYERGFKCGHAPLLLNPNYYVAPPLQLVSCWNKVLSQQYLNFLEFSHHVVVLFSACQKRRWTSGCFQNKSRKWCLNISEGAIDAKIIIIINYDMILSIKNKEILLQKLSYIKWRTTLRFGPMHSLKKYYSCWDFISFRC